MEDYVTFEQAVKLKELGFDLKCFCYFLYNDELTIGNGFKDYNFIVGNDHISAPTLTQVQKWLREKHNIIILVDTYFKNYMDGDYSKAEFEYVIVNMNFNAARKGSSKDGKLFESYEQALSAGLDKALDFLK